MLDLISLSAAIDRALGVLDAHGHRGDAELLRVHAPELFRMARLGLKAHEAEQRDCRECEHYPKPTTQPVRTDRYGNGG